MLQGPVSYTWKGHHACSLHLVVLPYLLGIRAMYEMIRLSRVAWIRAQMFQRIEIIPPCLGPTFAGFPCSRMGPAAVGEKGRENGALIIRDATATGIAGTRRQTFCVIGSLRSETRVNGNGAGKGG